MPKQSDINETDLFKAALNRSMNLCSRREYCSEDIKNKLKSWGVDQNDAERIIIILLRERFIDDKRFAEAYVKDKYQYNKWGRLKIVSGLKMRNIPQSTIIEALNVIDEDEYRQTARKIVLSHRKFIKFKNPYDLKGKLLRYGLSKGFENSLLHDLLNDID